MPATDSFPRPAWTGALLAGGASRRMGRAKLALQDDRGGRLLDRPAAALRATCAELRIVGRLPQDVTAPQGFEPLADAVGPPAPTGTAVARTGDDRPSGCGPLAGLVAALETRDDGWVLLCAGDLPEVDAALVSALQDEAEKDPQRACLPRSERGPEPGLSAWPRSRAREVRARFDAGERALHRALPEAAIRSWPQAHWQAVSGADALRNLNTPQDWREWSGDALPED